MELIIFTHKGTWRDDFSADDCPRCRYLQRCLCRTRSPTRSRTGDGRPCLVRTSAARSCRAPVNVATLLLEPMSIKQSIYFKSIELTSYPAFAMATSQGKLLLKTLRDWQSVQPYTILYCTVLYCTVLYCTILYYTILYYSNLYSAESPANQKRWRRVIASLRVICSGEQFRL